ncbi:MAG: short chain dehydrogenase [Phototrophicales bacterium]|nr:MAG: short chain dehydrogenase [Phototrophicales bacterium]
MPDFSGKVALVTGGASGIGRATAIAFAKAGAKVAVADVNEKGGEQTVQKIREQQGEAIFIKTDVSQSAQVQNMVKTTVDTFGRLDYAFNNAGISGDQLPIHETPEELWHRVISINLTGVWLCMKYEIPQMLKNGGGAIVNTSSVLGLVGIQYLSPYVAAKHGVVGITKEAALTYGPQNIRVNCVNPGVIRTAMTTENPSIPVEAMEQMAATQPIPRMADPSEVAAVVVFLCSDEASYITGVALPVDGGHVAR